MRRAWLVLALVVTLVPAFARAGRPLAVDDAEPVAPRHFELEAGLAYWHDVTTHHCDLPMGLAYGLVPTLEVGFGVGGQLEQREEILGDITSEIDFGDLVLGAKWNPLGEKTFGASHALALKVKFPTADCDKGLGSGEADFDLTYICSKTVTDRLNAHLNAGYTWTGDTPTERANDIAHCGCALCCQATRKVELVAEVFTDIPLQDEGNSPVALNSGVRWEVFDDFVLDAAIGAGLRGDSPDWTATIGFTWTFGLKKQTRKKQETT